MSNNELQHFGVKGMKWGVRKKRANSRIDRWKTGSTTNRKTKAVAMEAGKLALTSTLISAGGLALGMAFKSKPAIRGGVNVVTNLMNIGALANTTVNTVDIIRTDRKNG